MKKAIRKIYSHIQPFLIKIGEKRANTATKRVNRAYKRLFTLIWGMPGDNGTPEFFDHRMDLYYQWPINAIPFWLERGIYSLQAIKMFEKSYALELCCGDGFNTKHFYSTSVEAICAVDFAEEAIDNCIKNNSDKNITYKLCDIRTDIPMCKNSSQGYTNVIWDAAIEHFTETEIDSIMKTIKKRLCKNGILSGYTIVERPEGKSLEQHEYEFKNMADLKRFFEPYFRNIYVFETIYKKRHNLFFYASDGVIPFTSNWEHHIQSEA